MDDEERSKFIEGMCLYWFEMNADNPYMALEKWVITGQSVYNKKRKEREKIVKVHGAEKIRPGRDSAS